MRNRHANDFAGIFNINKPARVTSHDVVNQVRRLSGQRRIGHAGTLDPMATGVLIICAGWATRLSEYLMDGPKRYLATVRLGEATDTYDSDGEITARGNPEHVTLERVAGVLAAFEGEIEQIPPMYSALKQQGVPLYKLARQGETVTRAARSIHIYELSIVQWDFPCLVVDVTCSKGTYVRSLAHDLGGRLGCWAHLTALVRTASGPFYLEDAVSLDQLAAAFEREDTARLSYPVTEALNGFDMMTIDDGNARRIRHGQPIDGPLPINSDLALAVLPTGETLAVLQYQHDIKRWQPNKVFQQGAY